MIVIKMEIDIHRSKSITHRSPYGDYNSNYNSQSPYRNYSRQRFRSRSQTPNSNFNRYNNPHRPPSRPRFDYNRSRSSSFTKQSSQRTIKIEHKENKPNKNTNFELNMYHPTETANVIAPTSWFYQLYVHTPRQKCRYLFITIRNIISFLLDTGASISVLNLSTYTILTKHLNINPQSNNTVQKSKTFNPQSNNTVQKSKDINSS